MKALEGAAVDESSVSAEVEERQTADDDSSGRIDAGDDGIGVIDDPNSNDEEKQEEVDNPTVGLVA